MADKQTVSTSSRLKRLSQAQLDDIIEGSVSDQESSDFDNDSTVDPDYNPGELSDEQINKSGDDSSDEVPDLQSSQSDDNCCIKASKHSNQTSGHNKTSYSDENCNHPSTSNVNKTQIDDYGIHSDSGDTETEGDGIRPTARCHQRTGKPLTRKRKRDPSSWKKQQYVDSRGKLQSARSVKSTKDCSKCKFKCSLNISDNDRSKIFAEYWSLNDDEKRHFFAKTTKCENVNRPSKSSRKRQSYRYFVSLNGVDYRVCKQFYLSTLSISQKRISNYHKSKNPVGGTPTLLKWGKSVNREIPQDVKEGIRAHIQAIPRIESHYCRSSTNKEYLAEGLSINVLYEKYLDKCHVSGSEPGKLHLYREIFNSEFNIAFHTPKKDRCDHCEASAMIESPTEGQQRSHAEHLRGKAETTAERDKDRSDKVNMVVCFDLQNVFALPTADVSNFFYRRKLNVYHMTAHCSVNKKSYGAVWNEAQNGRSANDIASSFLKILEAIVHDHTDDPRIKNIILWSDSCVPQNRNSIFSTAIKIFMKHHPEVNTIVHKYCEPGHSSIQEVDNLHSQIERVRNSAK